MIYQHLQLGQIEVISVVIIWNTTELTVDAQLSKIRIGEVKLVMHTTEEKAIHYFLIQKGLSFWKTACLLEFLAIFVN